MEFVGRAFSVPVSFVTSAVYSFVVGKLTSKWAFLSGPWVWLSCFALIFWVLEFVGVLTLGVSCLKEVVGTPYYRIHLALFFLVTPSMVTIMRVQQAIPVGRKWYAIGAVCSILTLCAVGLHYWVLNMLFGHD